METFLNQFRQLLYASEELIFSVSITKLMVML